MHKKEILPRLPICLDCLPVREKVREFVRNNDTLERNTCVSCKQEKDNCRLTIEVELYSMKHLLLSDEIDEKTIL